MTSDDMKVSKGLEFPVVTLPGVGHMPAKGDDEQEAARVFYVAATRATQRLVIGVGGDGGFGRHLATHGASLDMTTLPSRTQFLKDHKDLISLTSFTIMVPECI
jgi:superfamily I DNA/RNA helicase